jgi:hypothetical protein
VEHIAPYWKAVMGFIAPGAAILVSSVMDGSAGGEAITQGEWITAVCTAVITSAAVYAKSNGPMPQNGRYEAVPPRNDV